MSTAAAIGVAPSDGDARRSTRLAWLAWAAMVPWMVLSCVTLMGLATPNVIITPIMWIMLGTIWSYPLVVVASKLLAGLCRRYGRQQLATQVLVIPGAIGAFLFSMLVVPLALFPLFTDGYLALMGSCLLSIVIASSAIRWVLR